MGAAGFHGRVREGIGWFTRAMDHRVGVRSLVPGIALRRSVGLAIGRSACMSQAHPLRVGGAGCVSGVDVTFCAWMRSRVDR